MGIDQIKLSNSAGGSTSMEKDRLRGWIDKTGTFTANGTVYKLFDLVLMKKESNG